MTGEQHRSFTSLKEIWISLFDESNIHITDPISEYSGLLMLLETAFNKTKSLSSAHLKLKSSNERLLSELDWKEKECNKMKIEVHRLENVPCEKCSHLEAEMLRYKKKAMEAQNRMKSIANILKIGENIQDSQSPRKNSAFTLVSQMLLEDSPKRKKRCLPKMSLGPVDIADCETIIPETLPPLGLPNDQTTPIKIVEGSDMITSPGDSPSIQISDAHNRLKPTLSIDLRSPAFKRNLLPDLKKAVASPENDQKNNAGLEQSSLDLNGSLAEYVKEANSEFDKIWFTASTSKSMDEYNTSKEKQIPPKTGVDIVDETPEKSPQKKKIVWKMKEMKGPSEQSGKKRLKQMQLTVKQKEKSKQVDLCTLSGYDGGSIEETSSLDDARTSSSLNHRNAREIDSLNSDVNDFKPKATSTEKIVVHQSSKKNPNSPNYKYKRDTVRKKSERAKLDGWDCANCAEYYATLGVTSPSKLKGRLNKCSRHRDKFKPITNTPPGYWDPIFPDTQECRERGYYTSFRCPKSD